MLKHLLAPIFALSLSLTPLACSTRDIAAVQTAFRSNSKIATTPRVSPGPTVCVKTVCHSKQWWDRFAAYVEAVKQAQLLAFYEAVSIPYHTGTYNGYACGGDLPSCCTVEKESHGDPYAVEPGHLGAPYGDPGDPWTHASGLVQFMPGTWNSYHGYAYAAAAPVHDQYLKEAEVFDHGNGASHWYGDGCYSGG